MSDEFDWAFSGRDDAKAEIRAAVRYLFEGAAGTDRESSCWRLWKSTGAAISSDVMGAYHNRSPITECQPRT